MTPGPPRGTSADRHGSTRAAPDRHPPAPRRRSPRFPGDLVWVPLCAGTVATLCSAHYLPFYDYHQWLFQGHVLSVLLFGTGSGHAAYSAAYTLSPAPVPNLAAPFTIAALDLLLPVEAAGQLFVVLTALAFAICFGHLVRTLQGRPTAIEYLGFPWALGFFLAKGYLSYQVGLALVFALLAVLHRATRRAGGPSRSALWLVGGLGTLVYLSHLLAWGIGALAVLVHALVLSHRGLRRPTWHLLATLLPGVAMAIWYVLVEQGGSGISLYPSLADKAISLAETLQPFLRPDPFGTVVPTFWVNLLVVLGFAALVLSSPGFCGEWVSWIPGVG
jgi:hypothetical protein